MMQIALAQKRLSSMPIIPMSQVLLRDQIQDATAAPRNRTIKTGRISRILHGTTVSKNRSVWIYFAERNNFRRVRYIVMTIVPSSRSCSTR